MTSTHNPESSAEPVAQRHERLMTRGPNNDRTIFFSDAVMAIAMTLLVLEIRLPDAGDLGEAQLVGRLADDVVSFIACALAFLLIGLSWILHHRKFTVIVGYDARLQTVNLLFLFFVAIMPLSVRLMIQYGDTTPAFVVYALDLGLAFLCQGWIWSAARRSGLLSDAVDPELYRYVRRRGLVSPIVFLGSILLCLVTGPYWALVSWIALFPANILLGVWERRRRRLAAAVSRSSD